MNRIVVARYRDDSGFTLVEVLIVIVVLGILASIATIVVGNTRDDAVSSACKTDYKSVELSAEGVHSKTGEYPASEADLLTSADKGGVLREMPSADEYDFEYSKVGTDFKLRPLKGNPGSPISGVPAAVEFTDEACEYL